MTLFCSSLCSSQRLNTWETQQAAGLFQVVLVWQADVLIHQALLWYRFRASKQSPSYSINTTFHYKTLHKSCRWLTDSFTLLPCKMTGSLWWQTEIDWTGFLYTIVAAVPWLWQGYSILVNNCGCHIPPVSRKKTPTHLILASIISIHHLSELMCRKHSNFNFHSTFVGLKLFFFVDDWRLFGSAK
jgi:hypothetical protein